jgi:hypothetical protein
MHINIESMFIIGIDPAITVGLPGIHGVTVTGRHGIDSTAPKLAILAAISSGLAGLTHIANGVILTIGILSTIVATGMLHATTLRVGKIFKGAGAKPNTHLNIVPSESQKLIFAP